MAIQNDLFLRVLRGEPVNRPPVWMMRQAGRFLSEYREVRAKAGSFKAMIEQPEYAAEVTLQPVDLVGVDAAIIFSDILVVPEAMGLDYEMVEKRGPIFPETLRTEADLSKIHGVDGKSNLDFTYEAIKMVKAELAERIPLIGFAGAPWTIFCYMTEGSGSKTFSVAKRLIYTQPAFSRKLLQAITDVTIHYLQGQIAAGVDAIQIFDSWAGVLNREMFALFSLPYIQQICEAIKRVPKIVFAKGAFHSLDLQALLDCHGVGLDWTIDPGPAASLLVGKALQGNMDPCALYGTPQEVEQATLRMLDSFPTGRHIANLGHGIYPDIPRESAMAFVETVKSYRYDRPDDAPEAGNP